MLQTVEIQGFGPVTIRSLSKGRIKRIRAISDRSDQAAEVIRRGLVNPPLTVELAERLGNDLRLLDEIGCAILDRSWPNEG